MSHEKLRAFKPQQHGAEVLGRATVRLPAGCAELVVTLEESCTVRTVLVFVHAASVVERLYVGSQRLGGAETPGAVRFSGLRLVCGPGHQVRADLRIEKADSECSLLVVGERRWLYLEGRS